jgi:outer membrane protein TolC
MLQGAINNLAYKGRPEKNSFDAARASLKDARASLKAARASLKAARASLKAARACLIDMKLHIPSH